MAGKGFSFAPVGKLFVAEGRAGASPVFNAGRMESVEAFPLQPAAAVLSYGVACFEGLKAFRHADGSVHLFRPHDNGDRLVASGEALGLPVPPRETFVRACVEVTRSCAHDVPEYQRGSLYLRPILFGTEPLLGVSSGAEARFHVFGSPVGNYFDGHPDGGASGLRLRIQPGARVPHGGMGAFKLSANYASTLKARREVAAAGDHEALYLDARRSELVEETAGSNVMCVMRDGTLVTPSLNGSILPGITRKSLLQIAREDMKLKVEERDLPIAEVLAQGDEFFVCGTAVVVGPVAQIHHAGRTHRLPKIPGPITMELRRRLVGLQEGRDKDARGWLLRVT
ncbi:MAG TPA: branched-chain-amino-acid transaminase [Planctomycetota bacterium]|nr:branched-chain-amino-acid transaminase [Planctomycetota bacterium]